MSEYNPFAQLAEQLQKKNAKEKSSAPQGGSSSSSLPTGASPSADSATSLPKGKEVQYKTLGSKKKIAHTPKGAKHNEAPLDVSDDDALLFLQTVGATAPPSQKNKKHSHPPLNTLPKIPAPKAPETMTTATPPPPPPPKNDVETLFSKAMKGVAPIAAKGRDIPKAVQPQKLAEPHKTALDLFLEGSFEFSTIDTDEYCEGFVVGIDPLMINTLRAGGYSPEAHIDLHGKNTEQAHDALLWFIKNAYQRNMRTVLIITGKGRNSPDGIGVLRQNLQSWFTKAPFKRVVMAFCSAKPSDGGAGAMYVLLRKFKKASGKIMWERLLTSEDPTA